MGSLAWLAFDPLAKEPDYHGKPLSKYLDHLTSNWPAYPQDETFEAICQKHPDLN